MSRAAVVADLVRVHARELKMPGLARAFDALARQAQTEHWSHEEYLHEALAVELTSRRESAVRQRIRDARFPEQKTLATGAIPPGRAPLPPTEPPRRSTSTRSTARCDRP